MSIQSLRTYQSASASLQRMITTDLSAFDATGDVETLATRARMLRRSIEQERFPTDCVWPGVELADVASAYEAAAVQTVAVAA